MPLSLPLRINLVSLVFASLVAAVLTGLGGLFLHHQQRENAAVHARQAAAEIAARAQRLLDLELGFGDFLNFEQQCAAVIRGDGLLRESAVFDREGRQHFHSDGRSMTPLAALRGDLEAPQALQTPAGRIVTQPIVGARVGLQGHAVVAIDEQAVLGETLRAVGWLVASALVLFAFGLAVQQLILWRTVGQPLAALVRLADSIQPDASAPLPTLHEDRADDIGRLHAAFGRLLRRLGDARAELLAQNEQLESTVRERTAQLARLNEELAHDIERRKLLEAELRSLASTDVLTGLANRAFVLPYVERRLAQARRDGTALGLLLLDFDGFKAVNDQHGHAAGDEVLREMSRRIQAACRQSDVVARLGGDEFLVVFEQVESEGGAERLGRRIGSAFDTPVMFGATPLRLGASIGAALFPHHGDDAAALLAAADAAMYGVKHRGGGFAFAGAGAAATGSAGASARAPS